MPIAAMITRRVTMVASIVPIQACSARWKGHTTAMTNAANAAGAMMVAAAWSPNKTRTNAISTRDVRATRSWIISLLFQVDRGGGRCFNGEFVLWGGAFGCGRVRACFCRRIFHGRHHAAEQQPDTQREHDHLDQ